MSDQEREKTAQQLMQQPDPDAKPDMAKDWSTDYFPTSAKPVFIGWTIMVLGVLGLCIAVYLLSEHPEDPEKMLKKKQIENNLRPPDDEE